MPPIIRHRNSTISIDNTPLQEGAFQETFLASDAAAAAGTITVANISGFAINQILLLEEIGTEGAELVKTHVSTAPTGTTVTLAANTVKAHTAGTKVYIVRYDQIELSHTTTTTGSKTLLTTTLGTGLVAVQADSRIQRYKETEFTSGYYFARYKDSIAATLSDYTDYLTYGGWPVSTVGYAIENSLRELELTLSEKISRADCYTWLTEGLREVEGKLLRWNDHYSYNTIIGQITSGTNIVSMPSDTYDTKSNKSIIAQGLRIGTGTALDYMEPGDFEERLSGVAYNTTRSSTAAAATSINLSNSYDFASTGSVTYWVAGTEYTATYTGVTRDTSSGATGALTGVPASGTGAVTVTIPTGTYVWQSAAKGTPTVYTVRGGNIEVYPIPDTTCTNVNMYLDYAKVVTTVDSDGDTIDLHRYDMMQSYLTWRIKMKARNMNNLDMNDGYYIKFKEKMNDAIRTAPRTPQFLYKPRTNTMAKH